MFEVFTDDGAMAYTSPLGQPEPDLTWSRDGDIIKPKKRDRRVSVDWDVNTDIQSLTIQKAAAADCGVYTATARNKVGEASVSVRVAFIQTTVLFFREEEEETATVETMASSQSTKQENKKPEFRERISDSITESSTVVDTEERQQEAFQADRVTVTESETISERAEDISKQVEETTEKVESQEQPTEQKKKTKEEVQKAKDKQKDVEKKTNETKIEAEIDKVGKKKNEPEKTKKDQDKANSTLKQSAEEKVGDDSPTGDSKDIDETDAVAPEAVVPTEGQKQETEAPTKYTQDSVKEKKEEDLETEDKKKQAPVFERKPSPVTVDEGQTIRISCAIRGTPCTPSFLPSNCEASGHHLTFLLPKMTCSWLMNAVSDASTSNSGGFLVPSCNTLSYILHNIA